MRDFFVTLFQKCRKLIDYTSNLNILKLSIALILLLSIDTVGIYFLKKGIEFVHYTQVFAVYITIIIVSMLAYLSDTHIITALLYLINKVFFKKNIRYNDIYKVSALSFIIDPVISQFLVLINLILFGELIPYIIIQGIFVCCRLMFVIVLFGTMIYYNQSKKKQTERF